MRNGSESQQISRYSVRCIRCSRSPGAADLGASAPETLLSKQGKPKSDQTNRGFRSVSAVATRAVSSSYHS